MNLRPYQEEAVEAVFSYWRDGGIAPLVEVPTGGGKSLILASIIERVLADDPLTRVICLTHVKELIQQNCQEFLRLAPLSPAGIYSAGLGRRDGAAQVLFAGIQSVHSRARELGRADVIAVDEAHLVPRAGNGIYLRFFREMRALSPGLRILGLTATPYRLDSGRLDEGDDRLFDGTAYTVPVRLLINSGWLAPLVTQATVQELSVKGVKKQGGDYVASQLQAAVDQDDVTKACVAETVKAGQSRRSWLVFAAGVDHAAHIAEALRSHGVTAAHVTGETPATKRDAIVRAFKDGEMRALVNCGVLTTGFNAPETDLIAMMRPTCSTGLYVQMLGRGMRVAPGKTNCLVLDFAGNILRHGPVDTVDPRVKSPGAKSCPKCRTYVDIKADICSVCGHVFFPKMVPAPELGSARKLNINAEAARLPIMAEYKSVAIDSISARVWISRRTGSITLAVTYWAGNFPYREWLEFGGGWKGKKAALRWLALGGREPVPETAADAITRWREVRAPRKILVMPRGDFWKIELS